jgi:3'-5' exoribonuclease
MTLEAVMLHYLDDMDAKINGIQQFLKTQVPEGSKWSTYHRRFEQFFYVPITEGHLEVVDNIDKDEIEKE